VLADALQQPALRARDAAVGALANRSPIGVDRRRVRESAGRPHRLGYVLGCWAFAVVGAVQEREHVALLLVADPELPRQEHRDAAELLGGEVGVVEVQQVAARDEPPGLAVLAAGRLRRLQGVQHVVGAGLPGRRQIEVGARVGVELSVADADAPNAPAARALDAPGLEVRPARPTRLALALAAHVHTPELAGWRDNSRGSRSDRPPIYFTRGRKAPRMPPSDPEAAATEFADRFTAEDPDAAADAAALLSEAGREAVLDAFPAGVQFGELDAEDALEEFWYGLYGQYGEPEGVGDVTVNGDEVSVKLVFTDGSQRLDLRVDDGEVSDFALPSEYEPPAYADTDAFTERDVTVDAGDVALDGVLAVPEGEGPFPGVVLVHGSGIHDVDGTAGASKILRDFAWGLATEGIAVLRYEKRLRDRDVDPEEYTLDTVVVDDAVAALDELAGADAVDEGALFVAGHSQGGMAAPRIADRHGNVAGVVSLDGPSGTEPDPDDVRHLRYFLEPDGDLDADQEALLAQQQETAERLVDRDYEPDEVLRDKPGRWWDSVLDYDPGALAESIDAPVFALKTGRADPEVQPELVEMHREMLDDWRDLDLGEAGRVEFYDGLGHYFQAGHEPSTMTHLQFADNVAEHAVLDVAEWVRAVADT